MGSDPIGDSLMIDFQMPDDASKVATIHIHFQCSFTKAPWISLLFCQPTIDTLDRGPDKKLQIYDPAERNKEINQFFGKNTGIK